MDRGIGSERRKLLYTDEGLIRAFSDRGNGEGSLSSVHLGGLNAKLRGAANRMKIIRTECSIQNHEGEFYGKKLQI